MLVNNTKYRRSVLVFRKFYDGNESFTGGFPVVEDIRKAFAEYPALTTQEFQLISDTVYQQRLSAFYAYLGFKYSFFNPVENLPDSSDSASNNQGEDADYCPVDLPVASRIYMSLVVDYRIDGTDKFASIKVVLRNGLGDPVTLLGDYFGTVVNKTVSGAPLVDWNDIEGESVNFTIAQGQSEKVVVNEFQYKGSGNLESIETILLDQDDEDGIEIYPTGRVYVTSSDPAFLLNHISNLQQAYQDSISNQIAQEKIDSGEGIRILGKKDYIFTFEPDQPKRPVFIYPKVWGKLNEILLVQAQNMNIINDGAFLFNNGEPFEEDFTIDGEVVRCFIYSSKAMIVYPYRVEYVFKF